MDEMTYLALIKRIEALEHRVNKLEKEACFVKSGGEAEILLKRYPLMMNKTEVAKALSVTRATVYCMIADGRLTENGVGKIPTTSVVRLLESGSRGARKRKTAS